MKAQLTLCELRLIVICGLLAAAVPPCHGAKRPTVAQLEQTLAAETSAHKSDLEIARHFAGIALSERISQTTFARITEPFRSSPQSLQALRILADQAEFLDLPASESVADAVPDGAAQTRMLQAARSYVSQTLSLKDFPQLVDPFTEWYGLTPDGKILLMRDSSVQEIYALDLAKK